MQYLDSETWIYISLIAVFAILFFWNRNLSKKKTRNKSNFRQKYYDKKKETENQE